MDLLANPSRDALVLARYRLHPLDSRIAEVICRKI